MYQENEFKLSNHGIKRAQQRAINSRVIKFHQSYSDTDAFIGNGLISETVSKKAITKMESQDIENGIIDKLKSIAIVYAPNGTVVTILKMKKGSGRRYKRGSMKRYSR